MRLPLVSSTSASATSMATAAPRMEAVTADVTAPPDDVVPMLVAAGCRSETTQQRGEDGDGRRERESTG
jgi:hypothetical protein